MAIDLYKAERILAMREVLRHHDGNPSEEFWLREVFRWYSETFSTPLHLVETLPVQDVVRHYYESTYKKVVENENASDLLVELQDLCSTEEEQRIEAEKKARAAMDEWKFLKDTEAEEKAAAEKRQKEPKKVPSTDSPGGKLFSTPTPRQPSNMQQSRPGGETEIPFHKAEPDIKMSFIDLDELERFSESDGFGDIPGLMGQK